MIKKDKDKIDPIIEKYIPIANMIVETFGEDCEVVLHDLRTPKNSVVYVANNTVTNRKIGESFHHLVPEVILSDNLKDDIVSNYYFTTKEGKQIRSSSALLKDANNTIIGAICINLDTTKISQSITWLQSMLPNMPKNEPKPKIIEKPEHITEIVTNLIDNIIGNQNVSTLKRDDRLELISFMDSRGIFMMKGAVDQVAEKIGINKVTVYSYLDEVRGKR